MKSRDKLVLLADKLDRGGFAAEAALVDEVIVKRSFDEENRIEIDAVIAIIREDIVELIKASQGLGDELQSIFMSKLDRINDSVSFLKDFNDLSGVDDDIAPDPQSGTMPEHDPSGSNPQGLVSLRGDVAPGDSSNWWDDLS